MKIDKTKWYTIDYSQIEEWDSSQPDPSMTQNEPPDVSEWPKDEPKMNQAIPESTSEITAEKETIVDIIDYLNETTFSSYKPSTRKTKGLIQARLREGFTEQDFKKVIDQKSEDWLNHPQMCKFLRPETLFGSKFESYLNQKSSKKIYREEDFHLDD